MSNCFTKRFLNGRSLHIESLESRQLLSVNTLTAMQDDAASSTDEPAVYASESTDKSQTVSWAARRGPTVQVTLRSMESAAERSAERNVEQDLEPELEQVSVTPTSVTFRVMNYDSDYRGEASLDAPDRVTVTFAAKRGVPVTETLKKNEDSTWQSVDENGNALENPQVSMEGDQFTISGLESSTEYEVSVQFDGTEKTDEDFTTSRAQDDSSASETPENQYDTPRNVTCTLKSGQESSALVVTWEMLDDGDASDRGDSPSEGFTVTLFNAQTGRKVKTVDVDDDVRPNSDGLYSAQVKGLEAGQSYYAEVKANKSDRYEASEAARSETVTTKAAVQNVKFPKADVDVEATDNDLFIEIENMKRFSAADTLTFTAGDRAWQLKKTVAEDGTVTWDWADETMTAQVDFVHGDTFVFTDIAGLQPDTDYRAQLFFSTADGTSSKAVTFKFETEEAAYEPLDGSAISLQWVGKNKICVTVDTTRTIANKFEAAIYNSRGKELEDDDFKGSSTTLKDGDLNQNGDFFVTVKCEDSGKYEDSRESIPIYTKTTALDFLDSGPDLTYTMTGFNFAELTGGFMDFNYSTVDESGKTIVNETIRVRLTNLSGDNYGTAILNEATGAGVQVKVNLTNGTISVTPHDYLNHGQSTLAFAGGYYEVAKTSGHFRNYGGYWTAGQNASFSFTSGNDSIKLV